MGMIMKKLNILLIALLLITSCLLAASEEITVFAGSKKPGKVKIVSCSTYGTRIDIDWAKAKNAKKYQVYMKVNKGGYKKYKTIKKRHFRFNSKLNIKYRFKIRAINGSSKGKFSRVITQYVRDISMNEAELSFESKAFTGKAIKPKVIVKGLNQNDYFVEYRNNVDPGTAKVIIKGRRNYAGRIVKTFKITSNGLSDPDRYDYSFRLMNQHPIYDNSLPQIKGISDNKVKWNICYSPSLVIYVNTENPDITCKDFKYVNTTTNGTGYLRTTSYDDINYKNKNESALARGGFLGQIYTDDHVKAGKNKYDFYISGTKIGSITINFNSKAKAYTDFFQKTIQAAKDANMGISYKDTVKNREQLNLMRDIEEYMQKNTMYPAGYRTPSMSGVTTYNYLHDHGLTIDTNQYGCEEAASILTLLFWYIGVNEDHIKQVYINVYSYHNVVILTDKGVDYYGLSKTGTPNYIGFNLGYFCDKNGKKYYRFDGNNPTMPDFNNYPIIL